MRTKSPIEFCKIDVDSISIPTWYMYGCFEEEITQIADLIVETGELTTPLLVRQTGLETYEILNGHPAYLAFFAIKEAKERDPRRCEKVNAFVIADDYVDRVINQRKILGKY